MKSAVPPGPRLSAQSAAALERTARDTFGLAALREDQRRVIASVLAGRDTLALLPTGAGKSLCYQLPALRLPGSTVVVSPLIALMQDQADKLEQIGIAERAGAAQLNSARSASETAADCERIADDACEFIFTTPERLADPAWLEPLRAIKVSLFVIDEAHCISQWGHDFRPAYLEIGQALEALGRPRVLALTATATPEVVADIRKQLALPDMVVVDAGIYRPNLHFAVAQVTNDDEKLANLLAALHTDSADEVDSGTALVYTSTVRACEEVYALLLARGLPVVHYHGRMPAKARRASQEEFMHGAARVMVATNAFGMGVDKPDIRLVVHWQIPGSSEAYYQEAGRAGRGGKAARCLLLHDLRDRRVHQFFMAHR